MMGYFRTITTRAVSAIVASALLGGAAVAATCVEEQPYDLGPADQKLCRELDPVVRAPSAHPLREYELALQKYFRNFCHRDEAAGWVRDKYVRDTGPMTAQLMGDQWVGTYHGTHSPVVIWYNKAMFDWIERNRTPETEHLAADKEPVPDGAIMVKEMYKAPAANCASVDPMKLLPFNDGAAIMVRDNDASHDGWFWGWFGWDGWAPDYPANNDANSSPNMGFGAYCMNCHASARDNLTFSSIKNINLPKGHKWAGLEPLVFLSQDEDSDVDSASNHPKVVLPGDDAPRLGQPLNSYSTEFLAAYALKEAEPASWSTVDKMPSETYDGVSYVPAGHPKVGAEFLPSAQCVGCHDAGSTGLHFDMTKPSETPGKLWNLSPYATWRNSPMGLAGRDPIFFAQLASETQSFHPEQSDLVQNTCLGCHGFLGQRQYGIDQHRENGSCGTFERTYAEAVPYPPDNPLANLANYGALARDGISCMSCHRMVLGDRDEAAVKGEAQNACVPARQELLNSDNKGFGKTFTGSFFTAGPDVLFGPFEDPRVKPMQHSLDITPEHNSTIQKSELCGACHTVHLPIMHRGKILPGVEVYEQLTYPEWAFSAYRTGDSVVTKQAPDGKLPHGAGATPKSCQDCHMPSTEKDGSPSRSKIASIQEYSNFPQAEFTLPPEDLDLPVREGYSRHNLVGLNVFLTKMAQQFPDVLGIRTQDPMLTSKGIDPLIYTEQQMLDQAAHGSARVSVDTVAFTDSGIEAGVTVENLAGHKFPSGVGFRRAFLTFEVLDPLGDVIWSSGATDGVGRLVDGDGAVLPGENWWDETCSARIEPEKRLHQPHYQEISRQDQAQVYQELVSTPGDTDTPSCGHDVEPEGQLTTSFLSICAEVKDNRLLPHGYLPAKERVEIAEALGAGADMALDAGSLAVGTDPDYDPTSPEGRKGKDSLTYRIPRADLPAGAVPATVRARLFYQATPPFYLQDRFCTAKGADTERLYFLGGHLNLAGTNAAEWKLAVGDSGMVRVPLLQ